MSTKIIIPIFNWCFPLHSFICPFHTQLYTHLKRKEAVCSEMEGLEGNKEGRKSKRTFAFSKNTLPANTFASPPPAMLSSRITALKEGKSHPEPSADSNLNKIHPLQDHQSPSSSSQSYFLRSQIQTKMEKSPVAWVTAAIPRGLAKSRRQLETAAVRSTATGREGRKESEFIVYYTWSPFWPHKSWVFYFLSQTERFFS